MRIRFLGTGTSHGVPVIGCDCPVCRSDDPRDRRTRSSIVVETGRTAVLVDASPDLRQQALRAGLSRLDAVLLTHEHADHVLGLDDLRRFNETGGGAVAVHGPPEALAAVRRIFAYAFGDASPGSSCPSMRLEPLRGPIEIGDLRIAPFEVEHGRTRTVGYRLETDGARAAYAPDCRRMPEAVVRALRGVDVMILDALRPTPHPTHLSLPESLALLAHIGARRSYLTHLCHRLGHAETERALPPAVRVACDGLVVECAAP